MATELRYVAQAFWGDGLRPSEPLPFLCAVDAEEGAAILAKTAAGVIAYQQPFNPEGPIYGEPEILVVWGRVPAAAVSIDGAASDPWLDDVA